MTERLTAREQEVAALLIQGLSNKGIAETLAISRHTARNHLHSIFRKLEASLDGKWDPRCRAAYLIRRAQVDRILADPTALGEAILLLTKPQL